MQFDKLFHGKLIKRYKRFLADILLENGETITAHVPNSGAMTSTIKDGCDVWVSFHNDAKRKLKYTLQLTNINGSLICVNTNYANKIAIQAIQDGTIQELQGYTALKPEQKYGTNSRIDILLEKEGEKCYVEVKSVTLKIGDQLAFPDAVTTRGEKHLKELSQMVQNGHRAVMLYVVLREENLQFRLAKEIDKKYYETFRTALAQGVEVLVYFSQITLQEIHITKRGDLLL